MTHPFGVYIWMYDDDDDDDDDDDFEDEDDVTSGAVGIFQGTRASQIMIHFA